MILDVLPLELMREVLLDLPEVDIIQTVKCTRRLYHLAKVDKALGRRLQNRVFDLHLCLGEFKLCKKCEKLMLRFYLNVNSRRENDAFQWKYNSFNFWLEGRCKCGYDDYLEIEPGLLDYPSFLYDSHLLRTFENGTSFFINNDSLDEAIVNCGKLFNILIKFCVVRKLRLDLDSNDDQLWDKMNAFFNANPPDLRIQPYVSIDSRVNLDCFSTGSIFPNGLAEIVIHSRFQAIFADAYHEVFRRTPSVSFFGVDLPYTYEDLIGFFKDTRKLKFYSTTRITKQQICQVVQRFYEVKHDEKCRFEIETNESFLVKDFLRLIPKKAYRLHLKRRRKRGIDREWLRRMTWAEMTDRFGGRWALMDKRVHYNWEPGENVLRICSMKNFTENKPIGVSDLADFD